MYNISICFVIQTSILIYKTFLMENNWKILTDFKQNFGCFFPECLINSWLSQMYLFVNFSLMRSVTREVARVPTWFMLKFHCSKR